MPITQKPVTSSSAVLVVTALEKELIALIDIFQFPMSLKKKNVKGAMSLS